MKKKYILRTGGKVSARLADDEERKKGGEIIIAVSYTHLDVYKRQIHSE